MSNADLRLRAEEIPADEWVKEERKDINPTEISYTARGISVRQKRYSYPGTKINPFTAYDMKDGDKYVVEELERSSHKSLQQSLFEKIDARRTTTM